MTITEAGKDVVFKTAEPVCYRIGYNGNDETELEAQSLEELSSLWASLISEFGTTLDSVDYIEA